VALDVLVEQDLEEPLELEPAVLSGREQGAHALDLVEKALVRAEPDLVHLLDDLDPLDGGPAAAC
jgi:hypothetical protein